MRRDRGLPRPAGAEPKSPPTDDSLLLAVITEYDRLEQEFYAIYDFDKANYPGDEYLDALARPLLEQKAKLLHPLCTLRATRPETIMARVRLLAIANPSIGEPDPEGSDDAAMQAALFRDIRAITALGEA